MTKLAALFAALALLVLIGGTAVYTLFASGSVASRCGVSTALSGRFDGSLDLMDVAEAKQIEPVTIDRPTLVYFGYTFCPDVCPFDMARNALAVEILQNSGVDVGLVFVTIDPARDTPDVLAQYAADIYPPMTALTGTEDQIRAAAQSFQVQFGKGAGEGDFYLMDHSTFTYLVVPDHQFTGFFRREESAESIAEKSACLINGF